MNPQISFSAEEIKENTSTPKFPKIKSINSLEKDENTLDTLKQHIDKIYNDKDTLNNDNINETKNEKNILLNSSLINNNSNSDLNNFYISQFSFDEKSTNFLNKNENKENTEKKNRDQIFVNEGKNKISNNIIKDNNKEEEKEENNEIKYITKLMDLETDKNEDNNFNYELPLDYDNNTEFFNMISFPEKHEEKKENSQIKLKNNNENVGLPCPTDEVLSKPKKEKTNITPQKKYKNKMKNNINSAKLNEYGNPILERKERKRNQDNYFETKYNSSNKKINKNLKFSTLLEENKINQNDFLTERNKNYLKSNNLSNSLKNTNFTSKDLNSRKNNNKININDNISIKPFTIEKINNNENKDNLENNSQKNKIKSNIIKDITLSYFNKRNKKYRNSVNFTERNNNFLDLNIDIDKMKIIYEKNISKKDSRSFSISQKGTHNYSYFRNNKELNNNINNETIPSASYLMNKKIKNRVLYY